MACRDEGVRLMEIGTQEGCFSLLFFSVSLKTQTTVLGVTCFYYPQRLADFNTLKQTHRGTSVYLGKFCNDKWQILHYTSIQAIYVFAVIFF